MGQLLLPSDLVVGLLLRDGEGEFSGDQRSTPSESRQGGNFVCCNTRNAACEKGVLAGRLCRLLALPCPLASAEGTESAESVSVHS